MNKYTDEERQEFRDATKTVFQKLVKGEIDDQEYQEAEQTMDRIHKSLCGRDIIKNPSDKRVAKQIMDSKIRGDM